MQFDFEHFTIGVNLAYKRCISSYSLEDALNVFRTYFEIYEAVFNQAHPRINVNQIARIIENMSFFTVSIGGDESLIELAPEDYRPMIEQHFMTNYGRCDYNINHFFSGQIRNLRYYETLY